jgi:DNA polymerase III delta prime subunit
MDAQSALRRCIELFNHNTRFFIIVEDKYKLLKPILSRFCEIYVSEPFYKGEIINLYKYNLNDTFKMKDIKTRRIDNLKKELLKMSSKQNIQNIDIIELSSSLYEKGYSGLDIISIIENNNNFLNYSDEKKYELSIAFNKIRKEFRNEKIIILFCMNFLFLSLDYSLENISFM